MRPSASAWPPVDAPSAYHLTLLTRDRDRLLVGTRAAAAVEELRRGHAFGLYVLHAYVVLPDRVHGVLTPLAGLRLARIVSLLKRRMRRRLTEIGGSPWAAGFYERAVRDEERAIAEADLAMEPVRLGLVDRPGDYPWSSAASPPPGHPPAGA